MQAQPNYSARFVRRTRLSANEYHKNFLKLDEEIIAAVTSAEADAVTPLMSKIYLRLVKAPAQFWEREGVLRFEAEYREGKQVKAWGVLCETLGVASATARKALTWLHESGIIGYFAGKNGAGIRIFLNRARASIGLRGAASPGQKILHFARASSGAAHASHSEAASKDSFAVPEVLDSDLRPRAPEDGAGGAPAARESALTTTAAPPSPQAATGAEGRELEQVSGQTGAAPIYEIVARLRSELEPCVKASAAQAALEATAREMVRTREWFESRALPKAVRVAQHETYSLLRRHGAAGRRARHAPLDPEAGSDAVGEAADACAARITKRLSAGEIREAGEACAALFEAQGRSVEATLAGMSGAGGWLPPEDVPLVREAARVLLAEHGRGT